MLNGSADTQDRAKQSSVKHMKNQAPKKIMEWLRRNEWNIVLSAALIAFLLGLAGIRQQQVNLGKSVSWADSIYFSLRLFTFSYDLQGEGSPYAVSPPYLNIARFMAPVLIFYAGLKTILLLAGERIGLWRIRRWRNHALVFGAGRRGRLVALNLCNSGHRVVVVEKDPSNESLADLRAAGAKIIIGNAADSVFQQQARMENAGLVVALTSSEEANLEAALSASRHCHGKSVLIQAHVSRQFAVEFESHPPFDKVRSGVHVRFFDHAAAAARLLFLEFGLLPNKTAAPAGYAPRILLMGDGGNILIELLKMVVIQGQYAGARVPEILIVTAAETFQRRFPARHPQLQLVSSVKFVELTATTLTQLGQDAAAENTSFDLAFIAFNHDAETLASARYLMQQKPEMNGRIIACLRPSTNMLGLLAVKEPIAGVVFRDIIELGCQTGVLLHGDLDREAKGIHDRYVAEEKAKGQSPLTNSSLVDWDDLPESLRQANRAQADHVHIKLATLKVSNDPATLEALAEAEHRRWMAERIISGWRYAPNRDNDRKMHPSLKPFSGLSDAEKQKDRDTITRLITKASPDKT